MSCGSRQISAGVISALQVGRIEEELHNAAHPRKARETEGVREEGEGAQNQKQVKSICRCVTRYKRS